MAVSVGAGPDIREAKSALPTSTVYRGYVLVLLVVLGSVAWLDRNVLSALLQLIKVDFGLSDTQLGLLGGLAFGLFYALLGLPVGWLADRYSRRSVLALSAFMWSLMTALCGYATGFLSLFLARVGVGIGEAGAAPASQSLVCDYFPPERRGFALGVLYLYIPIGFLLGFLSGGWLGEFFGWRTAFIVVGLPGILLAVLTRLTLREPPRGYSENLAPTHTTPSLRATIQYFWRRPSLRHLPLAGAIHSIGGFAAAVWLPTYFIRMFGMTTGEAGTWMATAYGFGGVVGVLVGGAAADQVVKRTGDQRWYAWGCAFVLSAAAPFVALVFITDSPLVAVLALLAVTTLWHMFLGPVSAMMQSLAGVRRRAVAAALYLLLVNLVSSGVGPVVVGVASDYFGPRFGNESLRYALLIVVPAASVWAAIHFLCAARTLVDDLKKTRAEDAAAPVPTA